MESANDKASADQCALITGLWDWKESAPKQTDTGVAFTPLFLELNYWQAIITLYRQSLAVPVALAGELSPSTGDEMQSPGLATLGLEEEQDLVFMKVGQAGQTVLKIYRNLHRLHLINYTFLATHHIFMSGQYTALTTALRLLMMTRHFISVRHLALALGSLATHSR